MSNIQPFNLSEMPEDVKAVLLQTLMADRMISMQRTFDETSKRLLVNINDLENKTEGLQSGIAEMKETINAVSNKQTFLNKTDKEEWKSLTNIGKDFNPSLNIKQITALLRKLVIIQKYSIEPFSQYMKTDEAIAVKRKSFDSLGNERWNYHFEEKRLLKLIERKLTAIGRYLEFKTLTHYKDVWQFIDSL